MTICTYDPCKRERHYKKSGLCGACSYRRRKGIPLDTPSLKNGNLRPEEVPEQLHAAFDFSSQKRKEGKSRPYLYIKRTCLNCGNQKEIYVHSIRQALKDGKLTGKCHSCVSSRGASNHAWKGGRIKDKHGYIGVLTPNHPRVPKNGYVYEHRLVMEKMIGRYLLPFPEETVHHKNGIHGDNRPENLELRVKGTHPPGILPEDAPHCPTCRCTTT